MQEDPMARFESWLQEATTSEPDNPNAMALATCDSKGQVSVRVVLLKEIWDGQFVFYTNLHGQKGQYIEENPRVSLCFHWKSLEKQVRIEGVAQQVPDEMADTYFATRPRKSQIGAWASKQSEVLSSRQELEERVRHFEKRFEKQPIPRPSFWSGYSVTPQRIEFWTQKPFRLHERCVYIRENSNTWTTQHLYP